MVQKRALEGNSGTGVSPVGHGRDARATVTRF